MKTNGNDLSYPFEENIPDNVISRGLTKREWMATKIYSSMLASGTANQPNLDLGYAINLTDRLIEELNKEVEK